MRISWIKVPLGTGRTVRPYFLDFFFEFLFPPLFVIAVSGNPWYGCKQEVEMFQNGKWRRLQDFPFISGNITIHYYSMVTVNQTLFLTGRKTFVKFENIWYFFRRISHKNKQRGLHSTFQRISLDLEQR